MNREFKFRIWNGEKWLDDAVVISLKGNLCDMLITRKNDFNKCIIQQFTGLKDKNGKEIYEGDILQNAYYEKFKIEWAKEHDYCGFVTINLEDGFRNLFLAKNFVNSIVIGNIFQNPEILTK